LTVAAERALDLRRLMAPASIAVVGATDRPGSYAAETLLNLNTIGFPGPVWGVNPRRTEVLGRPCVPSVADLPEAVDAVVVAIPAAGVSEAVQQAGARGCGGAVIFSAGFAEVPGGVALQEDLVAGARRYQLPVCGPNGNGIVSPGRRVALWGDALGPLQAGAVALVSQSGNVAVNALSSRRGLHFHTVIASGNQAVLSAADYLQFLAGEEGVRSVALYLEDDGGPGLCDALATCVDGGVAVSVLKVGSSPIGARAASAHSGALAGDQRVFRSLVAEAGAAWADDVHELLELAKTQAVRRPRPARSPGYTLSPPRGLAIMTCSGGDSAQGADEAAQLGIELPALSAATRGRLAELLPSAATAANPLDYTSMVWGDIPALSELVRALGEDPAVGLVLVFYDQPAGLEGALEESWRDVREGIMRGAALSPVPTLVSSTLPELLDDGAAGELAAAGVPAAAGLRTGLRCARALLAAEDGDPERLRTIAAAARGRCPREGAWLPEHAAKRVLGDAGIPVPEGRVVVDGDEAVRALAELNLGRSAPPTPAIVLKLSAADVQHKSELGGVAVGLDSAPAVREAFDRIAALAGEHGGVVLAEAMAPPGVELIVAAHDDGIVPALVLGLGGIWTELLDDVAVVPLPADAARVRAALRTLRGAPLLLGARGAEPVDLDAVAALAARVGELVADGELSLVECNPVLAGPSGAVAVDAAVRR
jgi:acetate---CoA ligase (ADP-forming)